MISFKNLKKVAQEIGEVVSDEELYAMFVEADRNQDGLIDQEEFYRVMRRRDDDLLDDYDDDEDE